MQIKYKEEAINRLEAMGLQEETLKELTDNFQLKGTFENTIINCSSRATINEVLKALKKEADVIPYYIIDDYINDVDIKNEHIISVIYLTIDEELWDEDRELALLKYPFHLYLVNLNRARLNHSLQIICNLKHCCHHMMCLLRILHHINFWQSYHISFFHLQQLVVSKYFLHLLNRNFTSLIV